MISFKINFSPTSFKRLIAIPSLLPSITCASDICIASRIFNNSDTSINLNFIHRFTIMLIQMPRRNGHPVDLRTQFWQPWWYACVRVHHACYRLLIHSKITYLDVSSATSRGIQPSPRQKRDRRLSSRARWGLSILRSYLRASAGNIVTRLYRRGRRSNYIRESRVYAVRRSINLFAGRINGLT